MTIKEVEKKLNISRANIRFYEKEGLLEPKRNENEYRNYSNEDLIRLEKIILFRKCNISIENIRLIFNGTKNIDEVFKDQISVIENEVKQLEGVKIMCKKLSEEKSSIDQMDTEKYLKMMKSEEQKGNKFYNITEDYIYANEKLYQSIIENKEFKGGRIMKKGIKIGIYIASALLMFLLLVVLDYAFYKDIDWISSIIITIVCTAADIVGGKKYLESKNGMTLTPKDNIKHILITILVMVIALCAYQGIKTITEANKEPNVAVLEMSVKKSIIDIANKEFENGEGKYTYAESHKILGSEIKDNKIYVYVVANYGLFSNENNKITSVKTKTNPLTIIYNKEKNKSGIYELKDYKEDSIPANLKTKSNVNFEESYYTNQLKKYLNK